METGPIFQGSGGFPTHPTILPVLSFGLGSTGSTGGYSHSTPIGVGTGKLFHDHS
jgi:hypothetical protein